VAVDTTCQENGIASALPFCQTEIGHILLPLSTLCHVLLKHRERDLPT